MDEDENKFIRKKVNGTF